MKKFFSKFDWKKFSGNLKQTKGKKYITNLIILVLVGMVLVIFGRSMGDTSVINLDKNLSKKTKITTNDQKQTQINGEEKEEQETETKYKNDEKEVEKKLKEILENISGVGKVKVMVYFKGGEEKVPAFNVNDSTSLTEEKDVEGGTRKTTQKNDGRTVVMMNTEDGTEPLIIRKNNAAVTGVCIVAEGAENKLTKLEIQNAVINLFGLEENKVNVYPMKK